MQLNNLLNTTLVQIAIVIVVAAVLLFVGHHLISWIVRRAVKRTGSETKLDERKRENTLITIARTTFAALVWIFAILTVLGELGVNVAALLTGAGVIGVIVGLSAQNTVKDLLAGMFILVERQYRVGDVITLSGGSTGVGATGTVEEITLRITKLHSLDGTHITVRNGEPTVIVNQTLTYPSVVLDLNITYDSDLAVVQKLVDQVGEAMVNDAKWGEMIREPVKFVRVDNFTDASVVVRAEGKVMPASQWDVAGEFRRRFLAEAREHEGVKLAHS